MAVAPRPEADVAARRPIALLTWSNRMHRFAPVEQIVGAYCAKHGYDRLVSHTRRVPQLAASWEKVPFLIEMLPRYEAILQLDDDAVINQIDTRVETFLDANPEFDMLMTAVEKGGRRRKGSPVMGFFIMRHTPQIMNLLTRLLEDPACTARTRSKCCWEQDCFWQLLTNHASVWSDYNSSNATTSVGFLPARDFACHGDPKAYAHAFHKGQCDNPFAFHELGYPKMGWVARRAMELQPNVTARVWFEGAGSHIK